MMPIQTSPSVCRTVLLAIALLGSSTYGSHTSDLTRAPEHTYFVYQRTLYLENLLIDGSWWANPALLALVDSPQFQGSNVTPIGGRFVLASARVLFEIPFDIRAGIGFLGSGPYQNGSSNTSARNSGFTTSGSFLFSEPNIQFGVGRDFGALGGLGTLLAIGWETVGSVSTETRRHAVFNFGIGYLSPALFGMLRGSFSVFGTMHTFGGPDWLLDGKVGCIAETSDHTIRGTTELTVSLAPDPKLPLTPQFDNYNVFKTLWSIRVMGDMAGLIGLSTDLAGFKDHLIGQGEDNGNVIHLGAEIRPIGSRALYGGYELGISTTWSAHILHRLWFGFRFGGSGRSS